MSAGPVDEPEPLTTLIGLPPGSRKIKCHRAGDDHDPAARAKFGDLFEIFHRPFVGDIIRPGQVDDRFVDIDHAQRDQYATCCENEISVDAARQDRAPCSGTFPCRPTDPQICDPR